jgi:glycosyltransferase involved in cell wall biosynthesis
MDALIVGAVGRLVPEKGVAMMLRAWRSLPAEVRDTAFLCFIGPRDNAEIVAMVDEACADDTLRVKSIGYQADMPAWYATLAVLASGSWREGWPYNVAEAACSGVPTAGTQATGMVDAVADGQTGLLTPVEDAESFSESLKLLLTNAALRRQMGAQARERILREFSHHRVITAMLDEYARLLRDAGIACSQSGSSK